MKMRIAAVSYLNTIPMLEGLRRSGISDDLDIQIAPPSGCARLLLQKAVDLALCPVAVLRDHPDLHIITQCCIGCTGPVRTVMLYSNTSLAGIRKIYLDRESRTSNLLVQVLSAFAWNIQPDFIRQDPPENLEEGAARLSIGDKCFLLDHRYAYAYDLGEAWVRYSGLPFVFACWLTYERPAHTRLEQLNAALQYGIDHLERFAYPDRFHDLGIDPLEYLRENISFDYNALKESGLKKFLNLAGSLQKIEYNAVEDSSG